MKNYYRKTPLFAPAVLMAITYALPSQAHGESAESLAEAFSQCIGQAVTAEKNQPEPNIDNVFAACQRQYNAYRATLPSSLWNTVQAELRAGVQQALDQEA